MITKHDIDLWIEQAHETICILRYLQGERKHKDQVCHLAKDLLFLVAFVESLMCVEYGEDVPTRARELQQELDGAIATERRLEMFDRAEETDEKKDIVLKNDKTAYVFRNVSVKGFPTDTETINKDLKADKVYEIKATGDKAVIIREVEDAE